MGLARMHENLRRTRARLASASADLKRRPQDPDVRARVDSLRAEYRALALEDHIREVVDAAPPLSQRQREALAVLLRPSA